MYRWLLVVLLLQPGMAAAQEIAPGKWDVMSTAVDLVIPGAPGFLLRMAKGRSKTEHKCVGSLQARAGIAALLAPDPKARCSIGSQQIASGHYVQTLSCPQKHGTPIRITRDGRYDATGFVGQVHLAGDTPKGPMAIVLDQHAAHVTGTCTG